MSPMEEQEAVADSSIALCLEQEHWPLPRSAPFNISRREKKKSIGSPGSGTLEPWSKGLHLNS